jgi:sporulation and spore germination protein
MIPRNWGIAILIMLAAVAGMAIYGYHLHRQAIELQQVATDNRPIAPPVTGPTEHISLLVPDDARAALVHWEVAVHLPSEPTLRAREIVRALLNTWQDKSSTHPIGNAADVNAVFLLDDNHTAVIDMNSAFAEQHRSGILVEELTLASIARTLGENVPEVTRIKILIDGKERETLAGHADLTDFYNTKLSWKTE